MEWMALLLFATVIVVLLAGFPVAFTLGGTALIFAGIGMLTGAFNEALLLGLPNRVFGIMSNETLVAVPLFVLMGVVLEKSRVAEELLDAKAHPEKHRDLVVRVGGFSAYFVMLSPEIQDDIIYRSTQGC